MYGLSIGDKSGDSIGWTLAYFSGQQIWKPLGLANWRLFSEFCELWSRGLVIPCGDTHQSFIDALVKWFFDNFLIFSNSFRLVSDHCIARGYHGRTSFIYLYPLSFLLTLPHVLMLSIQAVRGLPRLRAPGVVPCIISFPRQFPCFLMVFHFHFIFIY